VSYASREVFYAPADGVNSAPRTVRVVRYEHGWDVRLGIGSPNPEHQARATAALPPEAARAVAAALLAAADAAEAARATWEEGRAR